MPKISIKIPKLFSFVLLILISLFSRLHAQNILKKASLYTSVGGIISSDTTTPFLLRSNQYGLVPFQSGIGFINVNLSQNYDSLYTINKKLKRFGYGYGLEMHTNLGRVNQMLLPVAYLKIRYGAFEFYAGRRREIQGLVDTLGTMGSYIWSGNALPMPKVEISIPNYTPILGNGLISIKGNFAHGWFGKGDSVQNVWLHQKSFYMRIGKLNWKIKMYGGFNHQVQWGGYPTVPFYDQSSLQTISHFSTDFPSYIKVVSGVSLNKNGDGIGSGAPSNDALNRAGNHLGSVDIGLDIIVKGNKILIYRQSIYEDGSLYYLNNIKDGLYGLTLKRNSTKIIKISIEYLNTNNQGGKLFSTIAQLRGQDNYFNNSIYKDGWAYKQKTIGNPLLIPYFENIKQINPLKKINNQYIYFNKTNAMSLFSHYKIFKTENKSRLIISKNNGNFGNNLNLNQIYLSQNITFKKFNILWTSNVSYEFGTFTQNNIGYYLSLTKKIQ